MDYKELIEALKRKSILDAIAYSIDAANVIEAALYARLGAISNSLETMGFPCEAALVRRGLPKKEISKVRRMLTEYGLSGWNMTYILFKDKELHDKIKKKEKRLQ